MMKKNLINLAVGSAITLSVPMVFADLPAKANLSITGLGSEITGCTAGVINPATGNCTNPYAGGVDEPAFNVTGATGSFFNLGADSYITGFNGINIGVIQDASGEHLGTIPTGTEIPDIDDPWQFAGNTGMHQTTSPITVINATTLDFSGWNVAWGSSSSIPMGGDVVNFPSELGEATITCSTPACADGDTYVLDHAAHVPDGVPGFTGAAYTLHLEGTITDTNVAPVASQNPLLSSLAPLGQVTIDLAANVSDPDGDGVDNTSFVINYTGSSRDPEPTIVDDGNGNVTYTDLDGSNTTVADTFEYTVLDALGKISATFTVDVNVVSGNISPIANTIAVTTDKNVSIVVPAFASTSDPDDVSGADPTTITTSNEINGTVDSVDPVSGDVAFTPDMDFTGTASFDYTVNDKSGNAATETSNPATVTITVNDPPVATDFTIQVDRNTTNNHVVNNTTSDTDGTVDIATITASNGNVSGGTTSISAATGEIIYTPPSATFIGMDEYTYTIDDNNGATSNAGTVTVMVNNVVPAAANDQPSININNDVDITIDVLANDSDVDGTIDETTVAIIANAMHGTASVNSTTGEVIYTHDNSGFVGQDSFTYTVMDNDSGVSNIAVVTVASSTGTCTVPDNAFLIFETGLIGSDDKVEPPLGDGSWFSMELTPNQPTHTSITGFNHLQLGVLQGATSETPNIDNPWDFNGVLGVHKTEGNPISCLTDDGNGNATFDFSNWFVFWSKTNFDLGEGPDNGIATVTCGTDCSLGDTFVLDYRAQVPSDAPDFANVKYSLHMEGKIASTGAKVGCGDETAASNVDGISAIAECPAAGVTPTVLNIMPGSIAKGLGNATGIGLSAADVGTKDPFLNDSDGQQCIGGCIDFEITGVTSDHVNLVFKLDKQIPEGALFRKLINGKWGVFDTSQGDLVGSLPLDNASGNCLSPEGVYDSGLRVGAQCIYLRVFDGGPNDADGVKNGTIVDPSGVLLAGSPNRPQSSKSSGSVSVLLIAVLTMLGLIRIKRV